MVRALASYAVFALRYMDGESHMGSKRLWRWVVGTGYRYRYLARLHPETASDLFTVKKVRGLRAIACVCQRLTHANASRNAVIPRFLLHTPIRAKISFISNTCKHKRNRATA